MGIATNVATDLATELAELSLSPTPPLPATVTTLALWQSDQGITGPVQSWPDSVNGIVLAQATSARRPLLAADGSYFGGRVVVQTDVTNSRYMSTGVLGSPLIAAGTKPWFFSVMRCRGTTGVADQRRCYQCGDGGAGGSFDVSLVLDVPSGTKAVAAAANSNLIAGAASGILVPHLYSHGINAAGQNQLLIDGASAGVAGAGLTAAACSLLSIGCYIGPDQYNDLSLALLMVLSARPSGAEEAAMLAWSQAYYGTP
jgi:hypothetical protein